MDQPQYYTDRSFRTPAFEIHLNGATAGREVIADVLSVSFSDDLDAIDSFEFSLNDWDPVALRPKYSSPWDDKGTPFKLPNNGPEIPNFEPGTKVALFMGYRDEGALGQIMQGEVISIATGFPASGQPIAKVRALDAFQRSLQKTWVTGNYDGTAKGIVDQLARENSIKVEWPALASEGEKKSKVQIDGPLYDAIAARAKEYKLRMVTRQDKSGDVLTLIVPSLKATTPVAEFVWGRTLMDFTPVLSAAATVAQVVVRGADPDGKGPKRAVEAVRTWADIGLSPTALGPAGKASLDTAVKGTKEVIKPDHAVTQAEAEKAADARLTELAQTLITGSGTAVGLPTLRAGATVKLTGLGARFSGIYRLTKTTHTLGGAGYTTTFSANKEVLE